MYKNTVAVNIFIKLQIKGNQLFFNIFYGKELVIDFFAVFPHITCLVKYKKHDLLTFNFFNITL